MTQDVAKYCKQCTVHQQAKLPAPTPIPLMNVLIGGPWKMLAADILEVPVSRCNNRLLLLKKSAALKSLGEKSCEIKGGGHEMAAMMSMLINTHSHY